MPACRMIAPGTGVALLTLKPASSQGSLLEACDSNLHFVIFSSLFIIFYEIPGNPTKSLFTEILGFDRISWKNDEQMKMLCSQGFLFPSFFNSLSTSSLFLKEFLGFPMTSLLVGNPRIPRLPVRTNETCGAFPKLWLWVVLFKSFFQNLGISRDFSRTS